MWLRYVSLTCVVKYLHSRTGVGPCVCRVVLCCGRIAGDSTPHPAAVPCSAHRFTRHVSLTPRRPIEDRSRGDGTSPFFRCCCAPPPKKNTHCTHIVWLGRTTQKRVSTAPSVPTKPLLAQETLSEDDKVRGCWCVGAVAVPGVLLLVCW